MKKIYTWQSIAVKRVMACVLVQKYLIGNTSVKHNWGIFYLSSTRGRTGFQVMLC